MTKKLADVYVIKMNSSRVGSYLKKSSRLRTIVAIKLFLVIEKISDAVTVRKLERFLSTNKPCMCMVIWQAIYEQSIQRFFISLTRIPLLLSVENSFS